MVVGYLVNNVEHVLFLVLELHSLLYDLAPSGVGQITAEHLELRLRLAASSRVKQRRALPCCPKQERAPW